MTKIHFPQFSREDYSPFEMRQLIQALELRFQQLESNIDISLDTTGGVEGGGEFAPVDHTHREDDITDLAHTSSIFDLDDVSPGIADGQGLVWDETLSTFVAGSVGGSGGTGVSNLNDLLDVSVPSPNDDDVLTWDSSSGQWIAQAPDTGGVGGGNTLLGLDDTFLTGQSQYDLFYNSGSGIWRHTGADFRWYPNNKYIRLAKDATIRWLDEAASAISMLEFVSGPETFVVGDPAYPTHIDGTKVELENNIGINWDDGAGTDVEHLIFAQSIAGGTPVPDPDLGSVTFLLTAENSFDGAQTFTPDIGGITFNWENSLGSGSTRGEVRSAQAKFGTLSVWADGAVGANFWGWTGPTAVDGGPFDLGADPFTLEAHVYLVTHNSPLYVLSAWDAQLTRYGFYWEIDSSTRHGMVVSTTGTNLVTFASQQGVSSQMALNQWHHVAITRSATGDVKCWLNGNQVGTTQTGKTQDIFVPATKLGIMCNMRNLSGNMGDTESYIDNIRITVGVDRYTTNFTPPDAPYDGSVGAATFIVGDPTYPTQIDGTETKITGDAVVNGATQLDTTLNVDGIADFNARLDANADLYVYDELRVYDSPGGTDYISFLSNATDVVTSFGGTLTNWRIESLPGDIILGDGVDDESNLIVQWRAAAFATVGAGLSGIGISNDGSGDTFTNFEIQTTAGQVMTGYNSGRVRFPLGPVETLGELRVYDSLGTDLAAFSHDGTDFNTAFTSTTDWNITGLANGLIIDSGATGGPHLRLNGTNNPYIQFAGGQLVQGVTSNEGLQLQTGDAAGASLILNANNATGLIRLAHLGAQVIEVTANETVRQYAATPYTSYLETRHDSTNFNSTFVNTVDWDITGLSGEVFIDAALRTSGDLTVGGTTTTINSNVVSIADNIILLNSDATDPPTENAGLEIYRGGVVNNPFFLWNETNDSWEFVNPAGETIGDFRGSGTSRQLLIPFTSIAAATPSIAFGDGDTGFHEFSDDVLRLSIGGNIAWEWGANYFGRASGSRIQLLGEVSSNTNPVVVPWDTDATAGLGGNVNEVSLIAGGVDGFTIKPDGNHTLSSILDEATGDEIALDLSYTVNKLTSGADTGLRLNVTETSSPGTSLFAEFVAGGVTKFSWSTNPAFTIYDNTGADSAVFSHDGANFNTDFTGTTGWDIRGQSVVSLREASQFRLYDGPDTAYMRVENFGTYIQWQHAGQTDSWFITDLIQLWLRDGATLRISDSTDLDYAEFSHDGTDFNTAFTNTTDWNITGLTGYLTIDPDDFRMLGNLAAATPPTNEAMNFSMWWFDSDGTDPLARIGFQGSSQFRIQNMMHGQSIELRTEDSTGTAQTVFAGNGDNVAGLYYQGRVVMRTTPSGIETRTNIGSLDTDSSYVSFNRENGSLKGQVGIVGGDGWLRLNNAQDGYGVEINADDAAGTSQNLFIGDPDGSVDLYFDGTATARTLAAASGGLEANNTLTGGGFERVLTASDIGGGGIPSGTTTDAVLRWSGSAWVESTLLQINDPAGNHSLTSVLDEATGNEVALALNYTTNKATSGDDTGFQINMTDTASPGTSLLAEFNVGGVTKFSWSANPTFTMYDNTGLDSAAFNHDGTDFSTAFTGTGDWNITGLTGRIKQGAETLAYLSEAGVTDGTVTNSVLRWSGTDWVEEERIRVSDAGSLTIYDSTLVDTVTFNHDGLDLNVTASINTTGINFQDFTNFYITEGTLQVYRTSPNIGVSISHTTTGADRARITGIGGLVEMTGADWNFTSSGNTYEWLFGSTGSSKSLPDEYAYFGTDNTAVKFGLRGRTGGSTPYWMDMRNEQSVATTGDRGWRWKDGSTQFMVFSARDRLIDIQAGTDFRIRDSLNTDYANFSHDGTDFITDLVNTADWNITGLAGFNVGNYSFDVDQTVGAGQDNYVLTYDNALGTIQLEEAAGGGGGITDILAADYIFETTTTAAPGTNAIRFNNATLANVSTMFIDDTTGAGFDFGLIQSHLKEGHIIQIASASDPTIYFRFILTSAPSDGGGYWNVPVDFLSGTGTLPAASEAIRFSYIDTSYIGTGAMNLSAGSVPIWNGNYYQTGDATAFAIDESTNPSNGRIRIESGYNTSILTTSTFHITTGTLQQPIFYITNGTNYYYQHANWTTGNRMEFGMNGTDLWSLDTSNRFRLFSDAVFMLGEKAAAGADLAAHGQLWVKNDTPNVLYYTDDAGTDWNLLDVGATPQTITTGWTTGTGGSITVAADTGIFHTEQGVDNNPGAGFGQYWVKNDTPNAPYFTGDDNRDWPLKQFGEQEFNYNSTTTSGDPGLQTLRFNNATPASITEMYIDDESISEDWGWILSNLADGDIIVVKSTVDEVDYLVASVNGTPTDNTGWWTVPLTIIHSGSIFSDSDTVRLSVQWFSQAAGGGSPSASIVGTWTYSDTVNGGTAPPANTIEFTNATPTSANRCFIWDVDVNGNDYGNHMNDAWVGVFGTMIRMMKVGDPTTYMVWSSAGAADSTTFHSSYLSMIDWEGTWTDGDEMYVEIQPQAAVLPATTDNGVYYSRATISGLPFNGLQQSSVFRLLSNGWEVWNSGDNVQWTQAGDTVTVSGADIWRRNASVRHEWYGATNILPRLTVSESNVSLGHANDTGTGAPQLRMRERTASSGASAGWGLLWVKNDAPNVLYFTDDTGTDWNLLDAGATATTISTGWTTGTGGSITIDANAPLFYTEQSADDSPAAGQGQVWVRDDTPNTLMYTDDTGVDYPVAGLSVTQSKVKTAEETRTSNATLTDDTHLAGFTLEAGAYYKIEVLFTYNHYQAPDFKWAFQFSQTPQTDSGFWSANTNFENTTNNEFEIARTITTQGTVVNAVDNIDAVVRISAFVLANATTGGTLDFQWAQNTSNAQAITARKGAYMIVTRLA